MVTIKAHPETGNIITPSSNNPEYGTIRVDKSTQSFNNGFFQISNRTAFIRGRITDLTAMVEGLNLSDGSTMEGKIIKRESFNPFYEGQDPKINPSTGEIVLTDGKPTYLEYMFTQDAGLTDAWVENVTQASEATEAEMPQGAPQRA